MEGILLRILWMFGRGMSYWPVREDGRFIGGRLERFYCIYNQVWSWVIVREDRLLDTLWAFYAHPISCCRIIVVFFE